MVLGNYGEIMVMHSTTSAIQVGVSACLLGNQVRFDGGHKRSVFVSEQLSRYWAFRTICPEMDIGLGVPRPSIRLVRQDGALRLQTGDGSLDVTERMQSYATTKMIECADLAGYILCAKSPSCGMERVRVYTPNFSAKEGTGLFAAILMQTYPHLPVEEDGRLMDPVLRENFVTRVFAYHDWLQMCREPLTKGRLIAFHSRYKYLLLAHQPSSYKLLGKLLGDSVPMPLATLADRYLTEFMQGLRHPVSRKNHTNVLQHIQGYFKRDLSAAQKQELHQVIDKYRRGLVPLFAPLTLLQHYLREYPNQYLVQQVYLNPHPEDLALRYPL